MDKIRHKLKGWEERNLSFLGTGVLIRAVIQAIPTYVMSVFLIPQGICDKIEQAICRFWWGGNEEKRKIHWKNKETLFKPKQQGGQDFRTMRSFNEDLLAKKIWRLHQNPDSLLARCLKAKYYSHTNVLKARLGHRPSFVWRSIFHATWVIQKGGCWKIGNGSNINVWEDKWLPQQHGFKILKQHEQHTSNLLVKDLRNEQGTWNLPLLNNLLFPFERDLILQIPLIKEEMTYTFMWMLTKDGNYTVKSGYNAIREWHYNQEQGPSNMISNKAAWKKLWDLKQYPDAKISCGESLMTTFQPEWLS